MLKLYITLMGLGIVLMAVGCGTPAVLLAAAAGILALRQELLSTLGLLLRVSLKLRPRRQFRDLEVRAELDLKRPAVQDASGL
jgi:hypothetical protein